MATWMNPKDIMLTEINQSQKCNYCIIPLVLVTQNSQTQRNKVEWWFLGTKERI